MAKVESDGIFILLVQDKMKTVSYKSPRVLQSLLIAIGGILIVFAFLADLLGYGDAGNFGIGQLFLVMAGGTRIYTLLRRWMDAIEQQNLKNRPDISVHQGIGIIPDQLAVEMTKTYVGNYQIVEALSREYGFDYFFLQPHLAVGENHS